MVAQPVLPRSEVSTNKTYSVIVLSYMTAHIIGLEQNMYPGPQN
jgi:hypothetical protein